MPDDPQYTLPFQPGVQGHSYVYGTEYEGPPLVSGREQHNAPCAICYIPTKHTVIMIPAKTSGWTREYYGYLMSKHKIFSRTMYECVDMASIQQDLPHPSLLVSLPGHDHQQDLSLPFLLLDHDHQQDLTHPSLLSPLVSWYS
jgi:hypothetical protein